MIDNYLHDRTDRAREASKIDHDDLYKVNVIAAPWIAVSIDREPWIVTLPSGKRVQLLLPLGAAVEIEEAGHKIEAGTL
jgi:hypothetical protein